MVLSVLGHDVPEITLRQLCECEDDGTSASKVIECVKSFGLVNSFIAYLNRAELEFELERGLFPIVYVQIPQGQASPHAVVVTDVDSERVEVLDPDRFYGGERNIAKEEFYRLWRETGGLTILIE
jgi:ABC-type bacteriocin/lantibiotic exporter with double-glycine peptidase domain